MTLFSSLVKAADQDTESLIFLSFCHIALYKFAYFHELQFSINNKNSSSTHGEHLSTNSMPNIVLIVL